MVPEGVRRGVVSREGKAVFGGRGGVLGDYLSDVD